jgi:TonB family protein
VLRDALASGHHPPEAILRAIADTARLLTEANGTAIALRTNDLVVCRARSGEIAPALGALLDADSGISGECFRTSRSLHCDDTQTDHRVDPEVCRLLGIRSIVAVPLRGPAGTFGIVEAFSYHACAFTNDQVSALNKLGEIAEVAYQQRPSSAGSTAAPWTHSLGPARVAASTSRAERPAPPIFQEPVPKSKRRTWILSAAATLMLLASVVVWWTWREPVGDSAAELPAAQAGTTRAEPTISPALTVMPLKPSPTVASQRGDRSAAKAVVRNAANLEAVADPRLMLPVTGAAENLVRPASSTGSTLRDGEATVVEPPSVVSGMPESVDRLANIVSAPASLPGLEIRISQGVTPANIIHQVTPIYPPEALRWRLEGSVTVEASVAEDGTVRSVKVLGGQPMLAAAAVAAVRQWRYTTSLLDGKPTSVEREITINFKLR